MFSLPKASYLHIHVSFLLTTPIPHLGGLGGFYFLTQTKEWLLDWNAYCQTVCSYRKMTSNRIPDQTRSVYSIFTEPIYLIQKVYLLNFFLFKFLFIFYERLMLREREQERERKHYMTKKKLIWTGKNCKEITDKKMELISKIWSM